MVHAFIMVDTAAGKSQDLLDAVSDFDTVQEAHIVAGDYDIVVEADADEVYEVLQTASTDVQGLDGVVDTKTYIAID
ncbi:Lrp/AsnC ligand binding domain-containing protein [Halomicrococcus gelatinilyticus]|uniref:Lrp/AsnC ligand binding domain-containing protein n=1 Tax=Halomicrococcus gelatinilyticus TaxID=1702103 RepID=UPI002E121668